MDPPAGSGRETAFVRLVTHRARSGCPSRGVLALAGLAALCAAVLAAPSPALAQFSEGDVLLADRDKDKVIRIGTSGAPNASQTVLDLGGAINGPRGLAVDGDGFVYLTSTNGAIWRGFDDGGDGSQQLIRFGPPLIAPRGLAVAPRADGLATNGTLYVAERPATFPAGALWKVDPVTGDISSVSDGGFLNLPLGVARESSGTLLVVDGSTINHSGVYRVDPDAFDPLNSSDNQSKVAEKGFFAVPRRLAVLEQNGQARAIFVTDSGGIPFGGSENFDPQVICVDATLAYDDFDPRANQTQLTTGGLLDRPIGIVLEDPESWDPQVADSGKLLVADADAEAIIRITFTPDAGGAACPPAGSGSQSILTSGNKLRLPWDLQIAPPADPYVPIPFWITDTGPSGGALYFVEPLEPPNDTRQEIVPGSFTNPTGVALAPDGSLIVLDAAAGSVSRVSNPNPNLGTPSVQTLASGNLLSGPTGVVVDSEGHILVVDRAEKAIVRVRPDGSGGWSQVLIARQDPSDPLDPLVDPISATLGSDGQLVVADRGDEAAGDVPRLIQIDPATGVRGAVAPPVPSLPALFGVASDADGSNLVSGDGDEKLVRQNPPIFNPTYRTESDSTLFEEPRGVDVDANRSVLVVDAGDGSVSTLDGRVRRIDTLPPPDTDPVSVETGDSDLFYDPFDIAASLPAVPPVLDLDFDGVPDGSDNCADPANPASVCSADGHTACSSDDDECAAQGLGSCLVLVCSGDETTPCEVDPDCQMDFGSCLQNFVCSSDLVTPCTASGSECEDASLGTCVIDRCSGDLGRICFQESDCQQDLGSCLDSACSGDGTTACNPNVTSCEFRGLGSCEQVDEDGDGRGNACDDCQLLANTDPDNPQYPQTDLDQDGIGDACDPCDPSGDGSASQADLDAVDAIIGAGHNGACSLDGGSCNVQADCATQTCNADLCSLDGASCTIDADCDVQLCGPSPADCDADGDVDADDRDSIQQDVDDSVVIGPGSDFDEDFVADEDDICPGLFDPAVCSVDQDQLCGYAGAPSCPGGQTCLQPDADQDGVGDACNDLQDFDDDEIDNTLDSCPIDANEKLCSGQGSPCVLDGDCPGAETCEQPDEDDDSLGDACDTCLGSAETLHLCSLDGEECNVASDCAVQTCASGQCSLDGFSCSVDADCTTSTCEFTPDRDGDFIQNSCDVCPELDDPRFCENSLDVCRFDSDCAEGVACLPQPDQDGDMIGDACDPDIDGDGVDDVDDNCPIDANANQADGDSDGVGDLCDPCPSQGPADDGDGDLIHDVCDNCPLDLNPRQCTGTITVCIIDADCDAQQGEICEPQRDQDGDGLGDVCDADADGDLKNDVNDSCPFDPNPRGECSSDAQACKDDVDCSGGQTCLSLGSCSDDATPCTRNSDCSGDCLQPDEDGDTIGDVCDTCLGSPEARECTGGNPIACTSDSDCSGNNTCELDPTPDIDSDAVQNTCDVCPLTFDPRICSQSSSVCRFDSDCAGGEVCLPQPDADGDMIGDACDPDIDGDGIDDAFDDCPETANASQSDFDTDGVGDACDPDFDGNGLVGTSDFLRLSASFGSSSGDPNFDPEVDLTGDGNIGVAEFLELSRRWGGPPGPGLPNCDGRLPVPPGCNP